MHIHVWWVRALMWVLVLLSPVLLVMTSMRLLMTDAYLRFEYNRSGFPGDVYGFSTAERLQYASLAVDYLVKDRALEFLASESFADGTALYNVRELHHMEDVQVVVQLVLRLYVVCLIVFFVISVFLFVRMTTRNLFCTGLIRGGNLTLSLILFLVLFAALNWNTFFIQFHQLFFETGTWRFAYSDTLIRLFPEQFWFDAALAIGVLTAVGAIIMLLIGRLCQPFLPTGASNR